MKILPLTLLVIATTTCAFFAGIFWQNNKNTIATSTPTEGLSTQVYRQQDATKSSGDWGSILIYTNDQTETYGTQNMLTAVLEFLPGKQLQDPHQHSEEEFTYIIEGTGIWDLDGVESPVQPGDLLYARPGDMHGIKNTGADTLKFFVVKWHNKNYVISN